MSLAELVDWIEAAIWDRHDARQQSAGFQVIRLGRWTRRYRHPYLYLAIAAYAEREAAEQASNRETEPVR
ncbi:hypothetical protein [Fodinicola acaciae]|uniref:hypothetical protein n=1 Tax=Fodinicola acaciae TaxID=2681555 RepID=UPI0013D50BAA|nr:hypothetical protein [Fodinicola acaciae]